MAGKGNCHKKISSGMDYSWKTKIGYILKEIFHIDFFKTAWLWLRYKNAIRKDLSRFLLVYRGTEIRLKRTSMIYNNGKLMIGYKDADPSFHTDEKNSLNMDENSKFFVDGYFRFFSGCRIAIRDGAVLRIKDGFMSYNSRIDCSKSIEMGDDVIISENVVIMDSDRHDILREGYERSKPIKIGDHVWIGIRAMILKGVTIGNGSIVAAGAIVTRDVPENCLVAGIPAKVIKRNIRWKK